MFARAWFVHLVGFAALLAASDLRELRVVPSNISLAKSGDTQRFLVLARDADGHEEDVTARITISSSDPDVVSVDAAGGLIAGRKQGEAEIRAQFGGLASATSVKVGDRASDVAVRFSPDVVSVLTIKGCNSSGCHGSPAGQAGFKLSLFGYDTAADHEMILRKHNGRRVNAAKPEESLLLKKPLFEVAHGGGRLMTRDSEEYKTILQWLQGGARLDSDGPRVVRLEMHPAEQVLVGKDVRMRVVVMGRLSDGTTRDMTKEVRYSTSDDTVAKVSTDGVITGAGSGIATVLARGMGTVAASQIGVVPQAAGDDYPKFAGNNLIDELVYAKQRKFNVRPAPLSTDSQFIRRAFLDTIGITPTAEEVYRFTEDKRQDKRSRLIDSLLNRQEYAAFWTVKFEDWFRNNQLNSQGRSQGKFKEWISEGLAQDRPYDATVRELVTSQGDTFQNPAANFWHPAADFMLKKFDVKKVTPTVSRLFLGIRMECAECHNHPLENFTQDDFYGLSAFFARLKVKHGTAEYRRTWFIDERGELEHPVSKKPVMAKLLGGETVVTSPNEDRRVALAKWITSKTNPYFARATVNRIWHEYFQTGIVEPFDDFRSTNPPTNRDLLDRLAAHFIDSGFRLKAVHRLILDSRTYQLSSRLAEDHEESSLERLLFASYQPRKLPAEVLLDSISRVTGVAHQFRNYPAGTRAMEVDVPDIPDYFLVTFGLPRRDILCERSGTPTLSQALHMINGGTIMQKVEAEENILTTWLKEGLSDVQVADAMYARAYSRTPSDQERAAVLDFVASDMAAGHSRRRALEGVLWTVLNSKEFQVNH